MAIKALTGLTPKWFRPESEQDAELPAEFKLRPLDGMQFLEISQLGEIRADGSFIPNQKGMYATLRYGLVDWKNVDDQDGKPYPFNRANVNKIPAEYLIECVNEILAISQLEAEEEKNSE